MHHLYGLIVALLLGAGAATAPAAPVRPDSLPRPLVRPTLRVVRASSPIRIDGRLDEASWREAAPAIGFVEVQPGNQIAAQVNTEAFVTFDSDRLYIAFRAFDDPDAVRATLRNRDEAYEDDWVGIILDTYGDAAQAYEIFVNPLGIQMDLFRSNNNEDSGFDMVFHSEGRRTADGYIVEIAVPFASLRFPEKADKPWRITFIRNHPREVRRIYSWATVDPNNNCLECQLGYLEGLHGIEAGTNLSLIPSLVGHQAGALNDGENAASGFNDGPLRLEPSLNLRYDFTSSLAAEATVNPDFSQVESDAAQIDVNSTFALSYPERRPFFQEGSDLFRTPIEMVYTRSINNPITATKVTGRFGRTSIAYLGAVDDDTPLLLPFDERSEVVAGRRSAANILRARRSYGEQSSIGALVTDRRLFDGGDGTAAGIDFRYQFRKVYTVSGQAAVSRTTEPEGVFDFDPGDDRFNRGRHSVALDAEQYTGTALRLDFERSSHKAYGGFIIGALSPTFRTPVGFVTGNDRSRIEAFQRIHFRPKNSFFVRISPGIYGEVYRTWSGAFRGRSLYPSLNLEAKGQTFLHIGHERSAELFKDNRFGGLHNTRMSVNSTFSKAIAGGFYFNRGRSIARNEDVPEMGRHTYAGSFLNLKPMARLQISPNVDYARMTDLEDGHAYFSGYILRVGTGFQFSRALSARLVTQYNDFDRHFRFEPLVSWRLNPFTVIYAGSTHGYGRFDAPYGYTSTGRQVFFKLQYLWQQ